MPSAEMKQRPESPDPDSNGKQKLRRSTFCPTCRRKMTACSECAKGFCPLCGGSHGGNYGLCQRCLDKHMDDMAVPEEPATRKERVCPICHRLPKGTCNHCGRAYCYRCRGSSGGAFDMCMPCFWKYVNETNEDERKHLDGNSFCGSETRKVKRSTSLARRGRETTRGNHMPGSRSPSSESARIPRKQCAVCGKLNLANDQQSTMCGGSVCRIPSNCMLRHVYGCEVCEQTSEWSPD